MVEFVKLVTDIPENVVKNTVIETDFNDGVSIIEFHNADLSLTDDQSSQYQYKYATVVCWKDEYYDECADGFEAIFIRGYRTAEEAIAGHADIVAKTAAKVWTPGNVITIVTTLLCTNLTPGFGVAESKGLRLNRAGGTYES